MLLTRDPRAVLASLEARWSEFCLQESTCNHMLHACCRYTGAPYFAAISAMRAVRITDVAMYDGVQY